MRKDELLKIGQQIREYQKKLQQLRVLCNQDGDAADYGTPTSKRLEERSQSSKKGSYAFAKVADLSKSHDL